MTTLMTLSPLADTLLTIACMIALAGLGVFIYRMFKVIRSGARKDRREWDENE